MLPKTSYWNIWEHPRNFVTNENKSENSNVTCKYNLLINIFHRVIFDIWHVRDIQYVLLLSLSAPPAFSKVIILFHTAQKMKYFIMDLFSKCDQIHWKLQTWSHLLKKSWIENFTFVQCLTFAHIYNVLSHSIKGPLHVSWPEFFLQIILIFLDQFSRCSDCAWLPVYVSCHHVDKILLT